MKNLILTLVFFFTAAGLWAQTGTLRGKVIDQKTGETLIGATVVVKGTDKGTITDFDGNYTLVLAEGNYTITISFVSYQTQSFDNVQIKADQVSLLNANMGDAETQLQEVKVVAKANRRTETALMVMQQKSSRIIDGITAQQISRLGDGDAAGALKRVTGVAVQGGKYVYVRGLGDRYTKTTLNGAEIPALDPKRNTVQMDMFPSNIIENIVVNKTFTPDMPGEATGGHVDIVTRDFPEQFTLQFSSSVAYNFQSSLRSDFLGYTPGQYDMLGMDGGARALSDATQAFIDKMGSLGVTSIDKTSFSAQDLRRFTRSFNTEVTPTERQSYLDHGHKFAMGNQINLGGERALGYNLAMSYSHSYDYYEAGKSGSYENESVDPRKITTDRMGAEGVKLSGLLNLNFRINPNNKIGFRLLHNQSGESIARYRVGDDVYEGQLVEERNLNYQSRMFTSSQVSGKHVLSGLNNATINWIASYTDMNQDEPDNRFFTNYITYNSGLYFIKPINAPNRLFRYMNEKNLDTKVDVEFPFTFRHEKSKIKFGAAYLKKSRDSHQQKFTLETGTNSFYDGSNTLEGGLTSYITDNIIGETNPSGVYYRFDVKDSKMGSYVAASKLISAYAMADMKLSTKLRVLFGLRYEQYSIDVANGVDEYINGTLNPDWKGADRVSNSILPSLNFTYELKDGMNLRLALSQTVARPVFREIAPQSFYDYQDATRYTGNPDLEESSVSNIDLRWENFFDRGEKVAISLFYKYFEAPIERRLDEGTANDEILYFNAEPSNLYGAELEFRKLLDFIPALSRFSVGANFTYVLSSIKLTDDEKVYRTNDTRPMIGQAPYVFNAYLNYNHPDKKIDANLGFNIGGRKMYLITRQNTPYVYETPQAMLNFNISKGFGEHWSIDLGVDNILNSKYSAEYGDTNASFLSYTNGTSVQLGVKYSIN